MFSRLLRLPEDVRARYDMSSLECIVHAAAPCPVHVKRAMIDWLGPVITEYYGATEAQRLHVLRLRAVARASRHRRQAHPRRTAHPRRGRPRVRDRRGRDHLVPRGDRVRIFRRPGQDGREPSRRRRHASTVGDIGHVDDGGVPVPDRPQELHDHLRRGQHLPAGNREPAVRPPGRPRRGRHRSPERRPRRGGQGDRAAGRPGAGRVPSSPPSSSPSAGTGWLTSSARGPSTSCSELPRSATGKLYKRLLRDKYWAGHQTSIV